MTLDEAIRHAEEKGQGDSPCAADHRQLVGWLKELRDIKARCHHHEYRLESDYDEKGILSGEYVCATCGETIPSNWPEGKTPC